MISCDVTSKQPRSTQYWPAPSHEEEEGIESRLKKARVNVSELLHDAFLVKSARSKEKRWHALKGHEKLLFLDAVSKQWNSWQENAAATVIPPAEAKVIWRTPEETRFARSRDAVAVCARRQGCKEKALSRIRWIRKLPLVSWFLDTLIQMCWTFAEIHRQRVVKPSMSSWL